MVIFNWGVGNHRRHRQRRFVLEFRRMPEALRSTAKRMAARRYVT
jgi:hypothetical protein